MDMKKLTRKTVHVLDPGRVSRSSIAGGEETNTAKDLHSTRANKLSAPSFVAHLQVPSVFFQQKSDGSTGNAKRTARTGRKCPVAERFVPIFETVAASNGNKTPGPEYIDVSALRTELATNGALNLCSVELESDPLADSVPSTSCQSTLVCKVCNIESTCSRSLGNHVFAHYSIYRCEICGMTHQDRREFDKHLEAHETGPWNCPLCWIMFEEKYDYRDHIDQLCAALQCSKCNVSFPDKKKFRFHWCKAVNVSGPYVCTFNKCSFSSTKSQQYGDHILAHCGVYRCGVCSVIYTNFRDMECHLMMTHLFMESKNQKTFIVGKPSTVQRSSIVKEPSTVKESSTIKEISIVKEPSMITEPSAIEELFTVKEEPSAVKEPSTIEEPFTVTESRTVVEPCVVLKRSTVVEPFPITEPSTDHTPPLVVPLRCGNCDQSFENQLLLDKHLETVGMGAWTFLPGATHEDSKNSYHLQTPCGVFRCGICKEMLFEEGKFKEHLEKHSSNENDLFNCSVCTKTFTTKARYKGHVKYSKCKNLQKCSFCDETFPTVALLAEHKKGKHTRFNCPLCNKELSSGYLFETHIRNIHFGVRPFLCDACGKTYATHADLRKHKETHTGEKSFVCAVCDKAFWYRPNLIKHIRTHTTARPFRCDLCPAAFLAYRSLVNHANDHSRPDVTCAVCNKAFSKIVYLNKHTRRFHSSEDSVRCATCGQLFQTKAMLIKHLRDQNCEKHLLCRVCERPFYSQPSLRKHLKTHVVSLRCSWCHKSFETNNHLKRHELLHSGNMPFQCSVCGKQYAQAGNFKYHMRTSHDVTLPFVCDKCPEAFSLPSILKQHKLAHLLL